MNYSAKKADGTEYIITLTPVYTDAAGGQWYEFANPLQMSKAREIAERRSLLQLQIGCTFAEINNTLDAVLKANTTPQSQIGALEKILSLREIIGHTISDDAMIDFAVTHFVIAGEKAEVFDQAAALKKREILQSHDFAKDFFLTAAKKIAHDLRTR